MLTTRDMQVVEFLKTNKAASTETIAEIMFPSLSACQKRLKVLFVTKNLKRVRCHLNAQYVYYTKLPSQFRHSLLVTDFYRELHKKCEIINYKIEPVLGDIRPDALVAYKYKGRSYLALLEVEISHKGFDYGKYDRFYSSGVYKSFFPVMPTIFIVGDNTKNPPVSTQVIYKQISTDFFNINTIFKSV